MYNSTHTLLIPLVLIAGTIATLNTFTSMAHLDMNKGMHFADGSVTVYMYVVTKQSAKRKINTTKQNLSLTMDPARFLFL